MSSHLTSHSSLQAKLLGNFSLVFPNIIMVRIFGSSVCTCVYFCLNINSFANVVDLVSCGRGRFIYFIDLLIVLETFNKLISNCWCIPCVGKFEDFVLYKSGYDALIWRFFVSINCYKWKWWNFVIFCCKEKTQNSLK